ncbi:MAG: hypothetical protein MHMPM18_000638 [Marteilia pararefringens]
MSDEAKAIEFSKLLLSCGANSKTRDANGKSILSLALESQKYNLFNYYLNNLEFESDCINEVLLQAILYPKALFSLSGCGYFEEISSFVGNNLFIEACLTKK